MQYILIGALDLKAAEFSTELFYYSQSCGQTGASFDAAEESCKEICEATHVQSDTTRFRV